MRSYVLLSLLCATASALNVGVPPASKPATSRSPPAKQQAFAAETMLEESWRKYVLLRPAESTSLEGWAARTPGTARTIAISSTITTLVSLPALLKNPIVFSWLLEAAARSLTSVH